MRRLVRAGARNVFSTALFPVEGRARAHCEQFAGIEAEPMDEPDQVKVVRAVGRTLREEYAGMIKEQLPAQLTDLLVGLEQPFRDRAPPNRE